MFLRFKKLRVVNDTFGYRLILIFVDNMNFLFIDEYDLESKYFFFCIL